VINFSDYIFRDATEQDIDQMVPLIMECLKCQNGKTNYEVIFSLSYERVSEMIKNLLAQNIPNHEFHFGNYFICEKGGEIVSICCGWKETGDIIGSENIRSNLMASFLGLDTWKASYQMLKYFSEITIPRQSGFLYLENASTKKEYRRSNIAYKLVYELIKKRKSQHPELETIHSHVYLSNTTMYNMFLRFQYLVEKTNKVSENSILNELFPVEGLALVSIPIKKYIELYEFNMKS